MATTTAPRTRSVVLHGPELVIARDPDEPSELGRELFEHELEILLRFAEVAGKNQPIRRSARACARDLLHEKAVLRVPHMEIADCEETHANRSLCRSIRTLLAAQQYTA